ncbi:MAG: type III secretion protein, partial [Planctomycetota bacterium]
MPMEMFAIMGRLPVFAMVTARLAGVVMFMPVIGGLVIPARVRALIVIGLAATVTPLVHLTSSTPPTITGIALALANELLLGVLLGLILRFVFLGLELGGLMIAQQSGLAFGQIADPTTGVQQSLISAFYVQLAGVVFLVIGGHRVVLSAALD